MSEPNVEDVQESARDPVFQDILVTGGKILYWAAWSIGIVLYYLSYYLSFGVLFVMKLLYRPLEFILLPIIYFGRFLFACLLAPFQFLARFEVSIYIVCAARAVADSGSIDSLYLSRSCCHRWHCSGSACGSHLWCSAETTWSGLGTGTASSQRQRVSPGEAQAQSQTNPWPSFTDLSVIKPYKHV